MVERDRLRALGGRARSLFRRWGRQLAARAPEGAAGISNRPLAEEARAQRDLPPAGTARGEADPALPPRPDAHPAPRDPAPRQPGSKTPSE